MIKADRETDYCRNLFIQESELLEKMDHPNIVKVRHLI